MSKAQVLAWIKERYGEPTITEANGVHVAVVPLYRGVAIGCGSTLGDAICDLRLELNPHADRIPDPPQQWERARRARRRLANGVEPATT